MAGCRAPHGYFAHSSRIQRVPKADFATSHLSCAPGEAPHAGNELFATASLLARSAQQSLLGPLAQPCRLRGFSFPAALSSSCDDTDSRRFTKQIKIESNSLFSPCSAATTLFSSLSLYYNTVCVALKLRSLRLHSPRLCRIAVLLIQTNVSLSSSNPPFSPNAHILRLPFEL